MLILDRRKSLFLTTTVVLIEAFSWLRAGGWWRLVDGTVPGGDLTGRLELGTGVLELAAAAALLAVSLGILWRSRRRRGEDSRQRYGLFVERFVMVMLVLLSLVDLGYVLWFWSLVYVRIPWFLGFG
ncbi:MAG: hypothetical protein GY851_19165 [bacterium]|nr:hypothetical protein [bacterium]